MIGLAVRRVLLRETRGFLHEAEAAIHLFATSRRGGTRSGMRSTPPISRWAVSPPRLPGCSAASTSPNSPRTSTPAISSSWSTPPGWLSPRARANRRSTTATRVTRALRGVVRALGQAAPRSGYRTGGARDAAQEPVVGRCRKLKVYAGPDHPHQAQRPQPHAVDLRKVEA